MRRAEARICGRAWMDEGMAGADAVGEIWSQPLEHREDDWRLYPEEE